jgi:hypothetical protein
MYVPMIWDLQSWQFKLFNVLIIQPETYPIILLCDFFSKSNDYAHRTISISWAKVPELDSSFSGRNHRYNALGA